MCNQCSLKRSDRLGQVIKRKWLFFVGESFFKIWPVTRNLQSFHRLFRCQVHLHVSLNRAYSLLLQRCSSPIQKLSFKKSYIIVGWSITRAQPALFATGYLSVFLA